MQLKRINQQVVVIMGASSGIGRAAALAFADRGAKVVCSARNAQGLQSLVGEIEARGGRAIAVPAEVADFKQVTNVAEQAIQAFGRIDTWVHLAAVSVYATFQQTHPDEFKRVIDVNLLGQVYGAMAALPHLRRERRGALIHISSVEAEVSLPFQSAYAASKHGIVGFLDSLRLELAREGVAISVTNVMPSTINTPFFDSALTRLGVKPRGAPPVYEPEVVVRALLAAAQQPMRNIAVGGAGAVLMLAHRLTPRLTDALLSMRMGIEGQMTDQPKSADAPNNLFEPTPDSLSKVHGDFGASARRMSFATALQASPLARLGAALARPIVASLAGVLEAYWRISDLRMPQRFRGRAGISSSGKVVHGDRRPAGRGTARGRDPEILRE